jgi:hypothetical protein
MPGNQVQIPQSLRLQIIGLEEALLGIQVLPQMVILAVEVLEVAIMAEIHHRLGLQVQMRRQVPGELVQHQL